MRLKPAQTPQDDPCGVLILRDDGLPVLAVADLPGFDAWKFAQDLCDVYNRLAADAEG